MLITYAEYSDAFGKLGHEILDDTRKGLPKAYIDLKRKEARDALV